MAPRSVAPADPMPRDKLISEYDLFRFSDTGIGAFAGPDMHVEVSDRLARLSVDPLTKVQLNQLLVLSKAGSMSDGFFQYYWCSRPEHPYNVTRVPFYSSEPLNRSPQEVVSHDHLRWGFTGCTLMGYSTLATSQRHTALFVQKLSRN
jgi:hypothetical protein